jgi:hypothetical protein
LPVDRNASASLTSDFRRVREQSVQLCANLSPEDMVVQSMPDTSPTKWHLAHITWFFERFVLEEYSGSYRRFNDDFDYLFNSYYYSVGQMHARPRRGLLSRPSFDEVLEYRRHVDAGMQELLEQNDDSEVVERVIIGLNHEQQHRNSCSPISSTCCPATRPCQRCTRTLSCQRRCWPVSTPTARDVPGSGRSARAAWVFVLTTNCRGTRRCCTNMSLATGW